MIIRSLLLLSLLFPQGPTTVAPKTTVVPKTTVIGGSGSNARHFNAGTDVASNSTGYLSGSSAFTVMLWFKLDNTTQISTYLVESNSVGDQWAVIFGFGGGPTNVVEFFSNGSGAAGTPRTGSQITISDTNWHHVAYRYDGTTWVYFLDGTKTTINASITFNLSTAAFNQFEVGNSNGGTNGVTGAIDEVYVYSSALSDGSITTAASCGSPGGSPLGHWPMTGASPEPDTSGSGNSLTLTGTTVVTGHC